MKKFLPLSLSITLLFGGAFGGVNVLEAGDPIEHELVFSDEDKEFLRKCYYGVMVSAYYLILDESFSGRYARAYRECGKGVQECAKDGHRYLDEVKVNMIKEGYQLSEICAMKLEAMETVIRWERMDYLDTVAGRYEE